MKSAGRVVGWTAVLALVTTTAWAGPWNLRKMLQARFLYDLTDAQKEKLRDIHDEFVSQAREYGPGLRAAAPSLSMAGSGRRGNPKPGTLLAARGGAGLLSTPPARSPPARRPESRGCAR